MRDNPEIKLFEKTPGKISKNCSETRVAYGNAWTNTARHSATTVKPMLEFVLLYFSPCYFRSSLLLLPHSSQCSAYFVIFKSFLRVIQPRAEWSNSASNACKNNLLNPNSSSKLGTIAETDYIAADTRKQHEL